MESNSDIFVRTVVQTLGATYGFGLKFEPGSCSLQPAHIGFVVPVEDFSSAHRHELLSLTIKVRGKHVNWRQPRVYAFERMFPDSAVNLADELETHSRLQGTDFKGLLFCDVLLLPSEFAETPQRVTELYEFCPELSWLSSLDQNGTPTLLDAARV